MWVYGALPLDYLASVNYGVDLSFEIDGSVAGMQTFQGVASTIYQYNILFFHNDSLSPQSHQITFTNHPFSQILFDYLVYTCVYFCIRRLTRSLSLILGRHRTFDEPEPTATSTTSNPPTSSASSSTLLSVSSSAVTTSPNESAAHSGKLSHTNIVVIAAATTIGGILVLAMIGVMCYWRKWSWRRVTVRSIISHS